MLRILRPRRRPALGPAAWSRQLSATAASGTSLAAARPAELPRLAHRPRALSASPAPGSRLKTLPLGWRQYSEAVAAEPLSGLVTEATSEPSAAERPAPPSRSTATTTAADTSHDGQELPFIEALLRQTPDRQAAQLRLEDWAGDMFRFVEETRRKAREARGQLSPQVLAHVSSDEAFGVFVWEWVSTLRKRLDKNGLKGMSKPSA